MKSDRTILIGYSGAPLSSESQCWWRVRAWDREGRPSDWSRPATWTMGLLGSDDWRATWIAEPRGQEMGESLAWIWFPEAAAGDPLPGARFFRASLNLPALERPVEAKAILAADNSFELFFPHVI